MVTEGLPCHISKLFFNPAKRGRRTRRLTVGDLLLANDLAVFEAISSGNFALEFLIFELFDLYAILKAHPNVNPVIAIGVRLLGGDLALVIKDS